MLKPEDIVKIIAHEFGQKLNISGEELNEIFKNKSKNIIKFRISGKELGFLGHTALIKTITEDGIKIILPNKVILIRWDQIESFSKARPRSERVVYAKTKEIKSEKNKRKVSASKNRMVNDDDDEDDDDFDDETEIKPKKRKPKKESFIPVKSSVKGKK